MNDSINIADLLSQMQAAALARAERLACLTPAAAQIIRPDTLAQMTDKHVYIEFGMPGDTAGYIVYAPADEEFQDGFEAYLAKGPGAYRKLGRWATVERAWRELMQA